MPELRMRVIALAALVVAASTGIGEAPAPVLSAEIVDLHARARQGEAAAQASLGFKYRRGEGVLQDDAAAARWFRAAAEQGHAAAQFNLGFHYREGRGVPQDDGRAIRWYRRAAEQGDADAQNNLAGMYARGDGVRPNGPEAVRWWTLAAEQRHAVAQFNLGFMYGDGLDLPGNHAEAPPAYGPTARDPATPGTGVSAAEADGLTVPQDYVRAYMWLILASRHGTGAVRDGAMQGRARAEQKMTPAQLAEARRRAREWRPARPREAAPGRRSGRSRRSSVRSTPATPAGSTRGSAAGGGLWLSATTSRPSEADYRRVFVEQNPWRFTGEVPAAWAPPVERALPAMLSRRLAASDPRRFQLVLGPRRVGKTTCLYQTVCQLLRAGVAPGRIWWLRLDHPLLMQLDLGSPLEVVRDDVDNPNEPAFVFLDELTYARGWDLWLKLLRRALAGPHRRLVECDGRAAGAPARERRRTLGGAVPGAVPARRVFRSGGMRCVDSGRGDVERHHRSRAESRMESSRARAAQAAVPSHGWVPELLVAAGADTAGRDEASTILRSQQTLRSDAVERAIYKDIPQAFGIDNPMMLERLLYTLAGQVTGLLSPQRLCRELNGLSQPTFDRYLSYLERAFLIFTLPNYSGREGTVQRRGRRLYFVDGAVRNAALQRGVGPLTDAEEMGLLNENLVAGHLHALARQAQVRLYHWREGNYEVDLIYDHPEQPVAFEIASSVRHETGGMRRVWVRGHENVRKRVLLQAAACNIGLLLRRRTGIGTPRSLQGRALAAILGLIERLIDLWGRLTRVWEFKWTPPALIGSFTRHQAA